MKKIFMVLGIITISANLFSMNEEKQDSAKTEVKQNTLTKLDIAKLTAASFGCLLFGGICLSSPLVLTEILENWGDDDHALSGYYIPAGFLPVLYYWPLVYLFNNGKQSENFAKIGFGLSCITSGILSGVLGRYVYKKISQSRRNKLDQAKVTTQN